MEKIDFTKVLENIEWRIAKHHYCDFIYNVIDDLKSGDPYRCMMHFDMFGDESSFGSNLCTYVEAMKHGLEWDEISFNEYGWLNTDHLFVIEDKIVFKSVDAKITIWKDRIGYTVGTNAQTGKQGFGFPGRMYSKIHKTRKEAIEEGKKTILQWCEGKEKEDKQILKIQKAVRGYANIGHIGSVHRYRDVFIQYCNHDRIVVYYGFKQMYTSFMLLKSTVNNIAEAMEGKKIYNKVELKLPEKKPEVQQLSLF